LSELAWRNKESREEPLANEEESRGIDRCGDVCFMIVNVYRLFFESTMGKLIDCFALGESEFVGYSDILNQQTQF
jgi:hypothetical protein